MLNKLALTAVLLTLGSAVCLAQEYASLPGVAILGTTVLAGAPDGGVQAIDATTGKVLWQNKQASWPMTGGSGKFVALTDVGGNRCSVGFFDSDTGQMTAQVGPIEFVPWAKVKLVYGRKGNDNFRIWIHSLSANTAVILWQAQRWPPVTLQNYNRPQQQQVASGHIVVQFAQNSVRSWFGPIAAGPNELPPPDKSLPLLHGEHAIASIYANVGELALIEKGRHLELECFDKDHLLKWSRTVLNE